MNTQEKYLTVFQDIWQNPTRYTSTSICDKYALDKAVPAIAKKLEYITTIGGGLCMRVEPTKKMVDDIRRKKKSLNARPAKPVNNTLQIHVDSDIMKRMTIMAEAQKLSLQDYVSGIFRAIAGPIQQLKNQ